MNMKSLVLAGLAGMAFSGNVLAHTFGAHGAGFAEGLTHPFLGLDHLLAMLAVGIWASQLGGPALWRLPLAFMAALAGGALLANLEIGSAVIETAIAGSVLVLGLLIAGAVRLRAAASLVLVATFALFHGHAHGLEMPQAGSPWGYGAGFLLTTAALHGAGVLLGISAGRLGVWVRVSGMAMAVTGLFLLAGGV